MTDHRLHRTVGLNAIVALSYFICGWLGLQLPYYGHYVTLIWVPTAIALSAIVLAGPAIVPGVFLGSFALNLAMEPAHVGASALVALGNTLGPLFGATLLVRHYRFRPQLDRLSDAFALLGVGVLATGVVTATFGASVLCAFEAAPWRDYPLQERLLGELDHRVKNTLATVIALAERSGDNAVDVADFRSRFIDRVRAIARTHEGLARSKWESMPIRDIVDMTLAPFAGTDLDKLEAVGDSAALSAAKVAPLTMVLHELATNAAKYGGWSRNGGRVAVGWTRGEDDRLRLTWRESGGPEIPAVPAPGYGLRLIEGLVDHQLGGRVDLEFRADGLACNLEIPAG